MLMEGILHTMLVGTQTNPGAVELSVAVPKMNR